ncbi:MAG: AmmeMemoRadiSam system protein B [Syntrophobacteraceae bacterium]
MSENEYPRLRNGLEAFPIEHSGKKMFLLRDRGGYSGAQLVFSPQVAPILMKMDGGNSLRDLQAGYMRETGQLLYIDQLEGLVRTLDDNLFLDNKRFRNFAAEEISTFLDNPVRKMFHAGRSYPENPEELKDVLNSFFMPENGGPGFPDPSAAHDRKLVGLVAPHIDLHAGGACFAHAYKALAESECPRTWIVLGTGHDLVENCFALTRKDFETPLGTVRCDTEICDELSRSVERDIFASEYNHRTEHTIEFQAVFLAFMQPEARIVPILCSFGGEEWSGRRDFVDSFAAALREIVLAPGRSVGVLASIDLAHVGPRYGDPQRPIGSILRAHLEEDASLLKLLEHCGAEGFIDRINRHDNSRKICGVAPLYTLARALEGRARGATLSHSHAVVDENDSFVTFASMAFHETGGEG